MVLNRDYIVYGLNRRPCCGELIVDVGIVRLKDGARNVCVCGVDYKLVGNIAWKLASRFIKVDGVDVGTFKEALLNLKK